MIKKVKYRKYLFPIYVPYFINSHLVYTLGFLVIFYTFILFTPGCRSKSPPAEHSTPSNDITSENNTCLPITKGQLLYDFGYVKPNEKREVVFTIQNPTEQDIQIQRVRSECKCMYATNPPKRIPSNGSDSVTLVFIAPKKPQLYDKKLIIQTTNPLYPLLALQIKADVDRPLVCQPDIIRLGSLERNDTRNAFITILNRSEKAIRPIYATSSMEGCIAQIPRAEIPPHGKLNIPLIIQPAQNTQEDIDALVNIHTDLSSQPQLAVKVRYSVRSHTN